MRSEYCSLSSSWKNLLLSPDILLQNLFQIWRRKKKGWYILFKTERQGRGWLYFKDHKTDLQSHVSKAQQLFAFLTTTMTNHRIFLFLSFLSFSSSSVFVERKDYKHRNFKLRVCDETAGETGGLEAAKARKCDTLKHFQLIAKIIILGFI